MLHRSYLRLRIMLPSTSIAIAADRLAFRVTPKSRTRSICVLDLQSTRQSQGRQSWEVSRTCSYYSFGAGRPPPT